MHGEISYKKPYIDFNTNNATDFSLVSKLIHYASQAQILPEKKVWTDSQQLQQMMCFTLHVWFKTLRRADWSRKTTILAKEKMSLINTEAVFNLLDDYAPYFLSMSF